MLVNGNGRAPADYGALGDLDLAGRCAARDPVAVRYVITSNNQRLFRTAWSILGVKADAEDALQAAYLLAFAKISTFAGRSTLSTWLTRIVANEALGRRRSEQKRRQQLAQQGIAVIDSYREKLMRGSDPELADATVARDQLRQLLEDAIAKLPDDFRSVFVLREIEGLSSAAVAEILALPEATVKTRLFRGRRLLQRALAPDVASALTGTFPFAGADCANLTEQVLLSLGLRIM